MLYLLQISLAFVEENMGTNAKPALFKARDVMRVGRSLFAVKCFVLPTSQKIS